MQALTFYQRKKECVLMPGDVVGAREGEDDEEHVSSRDDKIFSTWRTLSYYEVVRV